MADYYIHDMFPDAQLDEEEWKTQHLEDRHTVGREGMCSYNL